MNIEDEHQQRVLSLELERVRPVPSPPGSTLWCTCGNTSWRHRLAAAGCRWAQ